MKSTIDSFASLVARDYGDPVATQFKGRFSNHTQEVSFRQAMDVLDSVLTGSVVPSAPRSAATNSIPGKVVLKMED